MTKQVDGRGARSETVRERIAPNGIRRVEREQCTFDRYTTVHRFFGAGQVSSRDQCFGQVVVGTGDVVSKTSVLRLGAQNLLFDSKCGAKLVGRLCAIA